MSENTEIEDSGNATPKAQGDPSGGSGLGATPWPPNVKTMGAVTICRHGYIEDVESERDRYKVWAHKFRDLLAPFAWMDGIDHPNQTEKAIIEFDKENAQDQPPR
jgi:hypothetical protein